jgi:hypothetical protein
MSTFSNVVSTVALGISSLSFALSFLIWKRTHRPIVAVAVKTNGEAGNVAIAYDLIVQNSGTIAAKNIRIRVADDAALNAALGDEANDKNKQTELACFSSTILVLLNGDKTSCSFGYTKSKNTGFWKPQAIIPIIVTYESWFGDLIRYRFAGPLGSWLGGKFEERQGIQISDSSSFTGYSWRDSKKTTSA